MIMEEVYNNIPTWDNGTWTITDFDSKEIFSNYILNIFKEPGKYNFNEVSLLFNEQGEIFRLNKVYCTHPFKSKDFINYWDTEKQKCRKGVIFKSNNDTWYITRD